MTPQIQFMDRQPAFARMGDLANYANLSRDQQESYMRSLDKWRTNMAVKAYDYSKGHAKGLAEGLAEGERIGIEKGAMDASIRNAKRMLAKGLPVEDVLEFTELSMDVLIALQQDM